MKYNWLRWVGVLPLSIGAYALSLLVVGLMEWFNHTEDKWSLWYWVQIIVPIIANAVGGYYYIIAGTSLAPKFKKQTGLILLIILVLFAGVAIFLCVVSKEYFKILMNVASITAAAFALHEVEEY
jgi:hypothetical protein